MVKKDKFSQMQQGGGATAFEKMVEAAATVAAIERKHEGQDVQQSSPAAAPASVAPGATDGELGSQVQPRFMRLPNPQIPLDEYYMVSNLCSSFANMTRQDFVELAILEKLHNDGLLPDDRFEARRNEVRSRPPRGMRRGTKQLSK